MTESCARLVFNTVKEVAGHELKARIDVRVERGQMATGQEARTGRPAAVLQCSLGIQRQL